MALARPPNLILVIHTLVMPIPMVQVLDQQAVTAVVIGGGSLMSNVVSIHRSQITIWTEPVSARVFRLPFEHAGV